MHQYFSNLSYGILTLEHTQESYFSNDTLEIKIFLPRYDGISDECQISGAGTTYNLHKVSFGLVMTDHAEAIFKANTQLKHTIPTKEHFNIYFFYTEDKGGHWCDQLSVIRNSLHVSSHDTNTTR